MKPENFSKEELKALRESLREASNGLCGCLEALRDIPSGFVDDAGIWTEWAFIYTRVCDCLDQAESIDRKIDQLRQTIPHLFEPT